MLRRRLLAVPAAALATVALAVALAVAACDRAPRHPPTPAPAPVAAVGAGRPASVILIIGDGFGPSQLTLARDFAFGPGGGRFRLELMPVLGLATTHSASNAVTDSAAAATALFAGVKTDNRYVGLDAAGAPARSLADAAADAGWRVGIVTTTTVAHATPAAFYAHLDDRYRYAEIAEQLVAAPPDLVVGGGRADLLPAAAGGEREDGRDLVAEARAAGHTVWTEPRWRAGGAATAADFPLLVLLADDHLRFQLDQDAVPEPARDPSLAELTGFALETLGGVGEPFLLLVEGGRIDHAAHDFDAAGVGRETMAFDAAVGTVLDYLERHPETLVVLTADHATAGLAINDFIDWPALHRQRASVETMARRVQSGEADAAYLEAMTGFPWSTDEVATVRAASDKYDARRRLGRLLGERNGVTWIPRLGGPGSTRGHTGEDVPVFAAGRGAERFRGLLDNTEIALRTAELLGWTVAGSPVGGATP